MASVPSRPVLRWHGGKWLLAPWIISHFPPHQIYVEPFGGAASVLLRKPRCYAEIYNDLDDEVVNLFRVLRGERAHQLIESLRLTPFVRSEFNDAYAGTEEPMEKARRLIIRSFMGFGAAGASGIYRTGFRANSNRSGSTPAHDWRRYPESLEAVIARIDGCVIESKDAREVMAQHDGPTTLHYVDPPYVHSTRARCNRRADNGGVYRHELTDIDHAELLAFLVTLKGSVVLSGYPSALYDNALPGWMRVERKAMADGALPRMEVLWINPVAASYIRDLFAA